jgi:alkylhydroperoxidase/carboxymuconolactone decarboxylase family protein YurZ
MGVVTEKKRSYPDSFDAPAVAHDPPDGLKLLEGARPEVLRAHRGLMRVLGQSLPPVTKQLILVALATVQESPSALRRHVTRALAAGAHSDQIIDAVTLALPLAGLARVSRALRSVAEFVDRPLDEIESEVELNYADED